MEPNNASHAQHIMRADGFPWLHLHDLDAAWWWLTVALGAAPHALDRRVLAMLCENALETLAPALLVGAHAAGYPLGQVMAERLAHAYERRYGATTRRYLPTRLITVVRDLARPSPV